MDSQTAKILEVYQILKTDKEEISRLIEDRMYATASIALLLIVTKALEALEGE